MGPMKKLSLSRSIKVSLVGAGLTFLFGSVLVGGGVYFFKTNDFSTEEVFFRSWESKTISGEPVYNTIKYIKKQNKEVWLMNQSHHGYKAKGDQLDRLAIVIETRKNNFAGWPNLQNIKTASFYQLPPGSLDWSDDLPLQKINLKVDCRQCHSNGPRAIRPAPDYSTQFTFPEKATLFLLNLRIKFYGRMQNDLWIPGSPLPDQNGFALLHSKTCLHCHNDGEKLWNRARLSLQQRDSIRFLLENRQMPPKGFTLSEEERAALEKALEFKKPS